MRQNPLLRGLVQLAGHIIRRRNHVVYELDLTPPREPVSWAPEERVIEIGPENIDAVMTPELLEFLGGESVRKSLEGIRRGNRLIVVRDDEGYAAYGHVVVNGTEYLRTLAEPEPTPYSATSSRSPGRAAAGCSRRRGTSASSC